MARKYHSDSSDEYMFLKNKVLKILGKATQEGPMSVIRAKRQCKKFIKKMKEIESYHRKAGYPHPEAKFAPKKNLQKELEQSKQMTTKQPLTNPDGSLYQKEALIESGEGFVLSNKGILNPDGTLFKAPVDDEFLRTEE